MKFHIITAMYNVDKWIVENIELLKSQSYTDFQVILIDDISTDATVEKATKAIDGDPRFILVINQEKKFKTRNVVDGIAFAKPNKEDVILLVDGDDKLAHKDVLQTLKNTYDNTDCWMTYGSYVDSNGLRSKKSIPYKKSVISQNSFRKNPWLASHLKTFKYKLWQQLNIDIFKISQKEVKQALVRSVLKGKFRQYQQWKNINAKDLHDLSGNYIKRIDDKAFSYPMLEISGERACFIEEVLYIYRVDIINEDGPIQNYGQNKSEKWHTRLIREILMHKKKYSRLKQLG
jgi:glycosyltransferase involved in cell wall biosynthesis